MYNAFEENEISINANGGTEIAKRSLAAIIDPELQQHFQIISSRVRELDETKIRILHCHDLPEDPESAKFRDPKFHQLFHKFVFISDWQYNRYQLIHGIPYDTKSAVLETGIYVDPTYEGTPFPDLHIKSYEPQTRIVYTSTPQRGLHLLVEAFDRIAEKHPSAHLDVFSSFKIYGWEEADKPFEPLFDRIRNHPQMTYHGVVPNNELQLHLKKSHIFAYPSIWLETSCRAMIEAAYNQLICIHPNFGALAETSGKMTRIYQGDFLNQPKHVDIMSRELDTVLNEFDKGNGYFYGNGDRYIDLVRQRYYMYNRYNIDKIKKQWEDVMRSLLDEYPTIQSRKFPSSMFTYKI